MVSKAETAASQPPTITTTIGGDAHEEQHLTAAGKDRR